MTAPRALLLRVPGFGTRTVQRIIAARRSGEVRYDDLVRIGARVKVAQPFIRVVDWRPRGLLDSDGLKARFAAKPEQLSLFG